MQTTSVETVFIAEEWLSTAFG